MSSEYKLPDPGEGLTEAEIVSWKVKVGDVIAINDIVVEIETAKSLVELPSPYAGTVLALLVPEGETIPVGTPIIRIGDPSEMSADASDGGPAERVADTPANTGSDLVPHLPQNGNGATAQIDTNVPPEGNPTLVGYGPREVVAKRRARKGAAAPSSEAGAATQMQVQGAFEAGPAAQPVVEASEPAVPAHTPEPTPVTRATAGDVRVLAKPPVRKLARDLGIDITSLIATGPGGTVSRADVEQAATGSSSGFETGAARLPQPPSAPGEREWREPIKGVRKMMGQAMVDSAFTAPHVTEWITVDVTRTMEFVDRLKQRKEFREVKVSPLLVLARAAILAIRRTPEINSFWDQAAQEVVYKRYVNLGIAAATPRGLVVPNVKDAHDLSLLDLAAELGRLTAVAREGRTQPAEMSGGTFTITNVGVFGVDAGTPIINPGESAILCFGAVRKQPWVVTNAAGEDEIAIRQITTLALSFDHRHVDGEKGSRFIADVAGILEDPASALLF
jgi:pyruvate dehydrogenase E2 component (dihydrolipoamide acetyltransferase)